MTDNVFYVETAAPSPSVYYITILLYTYYFNKACPPDYHHTGFMATGALWHTHIWLAC